ncbi:unnamed protein product [Bursaphelenchus okinawaensis]|uniref:G-protein coupled receptors family 1 profile domain-containing protein n=1 Tax=Bursaphelenchus okinawaensis TaxID=465554 RepID=A0A811KLQ6_9BILA|nr:unnamed protein product [Bursaphelenchus okinawaensis]CAG9107193.1 unnamed protein product [Bursaphelenchus okinawaensis]
MLPNQTQPNCSITSSDVNEAAVRCITVEFGSFYDACGQKCVYDLEFSSFGRNMELEHFVYGHLFPVLVLLVAIANVMVALVLSQRHMVTPTNVVLKYMAVADLCVGIIPLPWNFFYHTLKNYEHEDQLELWWCYMYKYSMDAIPPVFHNIAMWLTVLLAGQRYISISYPLSSRQLCSVKNVRICTAVITLVCVLCGLPKSMDLYYDVYEGWIFDRSETWVYKRSCLSGLTPLVTSIGPTTFFNLYFMTRVFFFILLPSFLLTILNALLVRGIRNAQKRKQHLLKEKRAREAQRQTDSNSTSIMLVMVVSIFLVVNLPQAVFMLMVCLSNTLGIHNDLFTGVFPVAFMLVSNMLVMATYPINFAIYCYMSSSFRDTFRVLFCRHSRHLRYRFPSKSGSAGSAAFSRLSVRRSDPSVSVQLTNGRKESLSTDAVTSNGYSQPPPSQQLTHSDSKTLTQDTVFL